MKNGLLIVTGAFLTLLFSWSVLILLNANHPSYGRLDPYQDEMTAQLNPMPTTGLAERGMQVYADLGCVACHTQQVRRPGFGADAERGWGDRQTVSRDYVGQEKVQLGNLRVGPDLRNIGDRAIPQEWSSLEWSQYRHLHLYAPRSLVEGSNMPSYSFLYKKQKVGAHPSSNALVLNGVEEGYEIIPTPRAEALVAYMQSLRLGYDLPEAAHLTVEARQKLIEANEQQNEQE